MDLIHLPSAVINSSLWYDDSANNNIPDAIKKYVTTIHHLKREVVTSLPDISKADADTIYMVQADNANEDAGTNTDILVNGYDEYMAINGKWELIGTSRTALKNYAYIKNAVMRNGENGSNQSVMGDISLIANSSGNVKGSLSTAGTITATGDISTSGNVVLPSNNSGTVLNVRTPVAATDAANKSYVDNTSNTSRKQAEKNIVAGFSSPDDGYYQITTTDGGTKKVILNGWTTLKDRTTKLEGRAEALEGRATKLETRATNLEKANSIHVAVYNNDTSDDTKARGTTKGVVDVQHGGGIDVINGTISLCNTLPTNVSVSANNINWRDDQGYYIKIPYYEQVTKSEGFEAWINEKIANAKHISYSVVEDGKDLPSVDAADPYVIYLKKQSASEDTNYYDEWMCINKKWELIGDSKALLNGYITETQSDNKYIQPSELKISEGTSNGYIDVSVKGVSNSVPVHGLTSTAFTNIDYFAKATDLEWNSAS